MFRFNPKNNLVKEVGQQYTEDFKQRLQQAKSDFNDYDPFREELAAHFLPRTSHYNLGGRATGSSVGTSTGKQKGRLFDSSGVQNSLQRASYITSKLLDDRVGWVGFKLWPHIKNNLPMDKLVGYEEQLFGYTQDIKSWLNESNIRNVMHSAAREWVVYDCCAIYCAAKMGNYRTVPHELEFELMPSGSYMVEAAPSSKRTGIFWTRMYNKRHFVRDNPLVAQMDEELRQEIKEGEKVTITTACLPIGYGNKEQTTFVIYNNDSNKILWIENTNTSPIIFGRRGVASGETYPMGWAASILVEAQYTNTTVHNVLRNMATWVNPMWLVGPNFNKKNFQQGPGATIKVDSGLENGQSRDIAPLRPGGDPTMGLKIIQDGREQMRKGSGMANEFFSGSGNRSATEVRASLEQERQQNGSSVDDFREEILEPVVRFAGLAAQEFKILPKDLELNGSNYALKVIGDSDDYENTIALLKQEEFMKSLVNSGIPQEELFALIDYEALARINGSALSQFRILKSPEMVAAMRQEMEKIRQQAAKEQQAAAQAK